MNNAPNGRLYKMGKIIKISANTVPAYGFILWSAIIMIVGRHDLPFYGVSFLVCLGLTILAMIILKKKQKGI